MYDLHYREAALENGSTLRIYPNRTQVNTVCLMQGRCLPQPEKLQLTGCMLTTMI